MRQQEREKRSNPLSPVLHEESDPEQKSGPAGSSSMDGDDVQDGDSAVAVAGGIEGREGVSDEGETPRMLRDPGMPTANERKLHRINHIPFRSWCDDCVRGRGRDRQHRGLCADFNAAQARVPRVVMDYGYLTANNEDVTEDKGGKDSVTCLVMKETMGGSLWAYAVRHKGALEEPWLAKQIMFDLDTVGLANERFVAKSDQEASIAALVAELARLRAHKGTSIEESHVGDSNSNARAEVAVQEFKGMARTVRSATERAIGAPIPITHAIVPWIVKFAAANVTRYQVRADGKTALQRIKGYRGVMPVCEFAEVVHFRQQKANKLPGYEDRWQDGIWLGYDLRSGENIVGTPRGVFRSGAVRRKPEDARWSKQMIDGIVGDPEVPVPGENPGRPPTFAKKTEDAGTASRPAPAFMPGQVPEEVARGIYIRRQDVLDHGPSDRCAGCRAVMTDAIDKRPHSAGCRTRFEKLLAETEEGKIRVDKAAERLNIAIVKRGEAILEKKRRTEDADRISVGSGSGAAGSGLTDAERAVVPTATSNPEEVRQGRKRQAEDEPDDPRVAKDGDESVEIIRDAAEDAASTTQHGADDSAMTAQKAQAFGGKLDEVMGPDWNYQPGQESDDSGMDAGQQSADMGPLEGGSQVLTMAAEVPATDQQQQGPGPRPKPISTVSRWGTQPSGEVREPGQRQAIEGPSKPETEWKYVGSGIMARTFIGAESLVLTTRTGPKESDVKRRVIRDATTGKVIDDCVPENTSDAVLRRRLPVATTIRVELHMADAARMFVRKGADVAEVYSPPRIVEEAGMRTYGGRVLRPGWSLDLTMTDPESGERWDFSKAAVRDRALRLVKESQPFLIIGSPPCTAFSQLQAINKGRRSAEVINEEMRIAKQHMRFVIKLYHMQVLAGRYYLHEHPTGAKSWKMDEIQEMMAMPGTYLAKSHMCRFGMTSTDEQGLGLVKKATTFMTNSHEIFKELNIRCKNEESEASQHHRHVHLISGRARFAQTYPRALCQAVCRGVAAQKSSDEGGVREVALLECEEMEAILEDAQQYAGLDGISADPTKTKEMQASNVLHEDDSKYWATDDVTGEALVPGLVRNARTEEISYFRSMGVYKKVPRSKCYEITGRKPVAVRWIDINKGDSLTPNYRSRLVAK